MPAKFEVILIGRICVSEFEVSMLKEFEHDMYEGILYLPDNITLPHIIIYTIKYISLERY